MQYRFRQVDVFTMERFFGNPLAVVIDADNLSDKAMQQIAQWTNLSETVYLLSPTVQTADYRVRIFTPQGELPFAGHPTLGACHVWASLNHQADSRTVIQQCSAGLIALRYDNAHQQWAFAAPAIRSCRQIPYADFQRILSALSLTEAEIVMAQQIDNGASWTILLISSVEKLITITPNYALLAGLKVGICASVESYASQLEVRAFVGSAGYEDPITGSLQAAIAKWLIPLEKLPEQYQAIQGRCLGRKGCISIFTQGEQIWVAGQVIDCIAGEITIA